MILGDIVHELPSQLVVVEWGIGDTSAAPGANENFNSGWFDTWRTIPQNVIQPKTGQAVSTADESIVGAGTHRLAGVYLLDVVCRHHNAIGAPLPMRLEEIMAPALFTVAFLAFTPSVDFVVEACGLAGVAIDRDAYFSRTFRLRNRFMRLSFQYPASAATDWYLSATLRSS